MYLKKKKKYFYQILQKNEGEKYIYPKCPHTSRIFAAAA